MRYLSAKSIVACPLRGGWLKTRTCGLIGVILFTLNSANAATYDVSGLPVKNLGDALTATELNLMVDMLRNIKKDDRGDSDVSNDRVGIGIVGTPAQMLDVNGNVNATGFIGDGSLLTNLPNPGYWTQTTNDLYYNTGKVAIGINSSPTYQLEVQNTAGNSDASIQANGSNDASLRLINGNQHWIIRNNGGAGDNFQIYNSTGSTTVLDVDNTTNNIVTSNNITAGGDIYGGTVYATEYIDTDTGSPVSASKWLVGTGADTNEIYYSSSNVGIGVGDPAYTLDVTGDSRFSSHVGFGAQAAPLTSSVVKIDENTTADASRYLLNVQGTASGAITASASFNGLYTDVEDTRTETAGNATSYGTYSRARSNGAGTFNSLQGISGVAYNDSSAGTGLGTLYGVRGEAYNNDTVATIANAYGGNFIGRGKSSLPAGPITNLYGARGEAAAYEAQISKAYGAYNYARTVNGDTGDINNAYGSYNRVYVDSAAGGDITNGYAGYFHTGKRTGGTLMTAATGVYADPNAAVTAYGGRFYVDDAAATTNYGIVITAANATNNYAIYSNDGDWVLDSDGAGDIGGATGGDLLIGEDADLRIYHNGINSYISNKTGDLLLLNSGSGNVGVGLTNPARSFHVSGTGKFEGQLDIGSSNSIKLWQCAANGGCFAINNAAGTRVVQFRGDSADNYINNGGNFGIGTTTPTYPLVVSNGGAEAIELSPGENSGLSLLQAYNRSNSTYDKFVIDASDFQFRPGGTTTVANQVFFNNTGDVMIGDASADGTLKLDVEGTIGATQYCDENGLNCTAAADLGSGYWTKSVTNDVYYNGGEVGIGISNPTEELVVNKSQAAPTTVAVQNTSTSTNTNTRAGVAVQSNGAALDLMAYGTGATGSIGGHTKADSAFLRTSSSAPVASLNIGNGGNVPLNLFTSDATRVTVTGTGNVGVGITSPDTKLHVSSGVITAGSATATNGMSMIESEYSTGTNDNPNVIGTQYSSADWLIGYGVRPKSGAVGYVSSVDNSAWGRGALEIGDDLIYSTGASQTTAVGSDVALTERMRVNGNGLRLPTSRRVRFGSGDQMIYGDDDSALYADSDHSTVTQMMFRDKEDTVYGRVYGDGDGSNFGLLDGDGNWGIKLNKDTVTQFYINNDEKMRINSAGNVGIGTTNPGAKLEVNALAGDGILLRSNNALLGEGAAGITQLLYWSGANNIAYWGRNSANVPGGVGDVVNQHEFRTGGTTRFTINSSGNVGIGTTTPGEKLEVSGSILLSSAAPKVWFDSANKFGIGYNSSTKLQFFTNGGISSTLQQIGNGASDRAILQVNQYASGTPTSADSYPAFTFAQDIDTGMYLADIGDVGISTGGVGRLLVDASGNVGIGTTAPTEELYVTKSQTAPTTIVAQNSSTGASTTVRSGFTASANGGQLDMMQYGTGATGSLSGVTRADAAYIRTSSSAPSSAMVIGNGGAVPLHLVTNDAVQLTVDGTGDVGIGDATPDGTLKLDVEGQIGATEYCDEDGLGCVVASALGGVWAEAGGDTSYGGDADIGGNLAVGNNASINSNRTGNFVRNSTTGTANQYGIYTDLTHNSSLTANRTQYGIFSRHINSGNENGFNLDTVGVRGEAENNGSSTANDVYGLQGVVDQNSTGVIDSARGLYAATQVAVGTTVTTNRGLQIDLDNQGTIGTNYGIHIIDVIEGTQTNAYALWANEGDFVLDGDGDGVAGGTNTGTDLFFGEGQDAAMWYDGSNFNINPRKVGAGDVAIPSGNLTLSGGRIIRFGTGNQRLYGDNSSLMYLTSNHSTTTQLLLRDSENDVYGRLYGSGNGANFGLLDGDGEWGIQMVKDSYTGFRVNNLEKMRILANGNVGIGTTNPSEKLDIAGGVNIVNGVGSMQIGNVDNTAGNEYVRNSILMSRDGDLTWDSANNLWKKPNGGSNDFSAILHRNDNLSFTVGTAVDLSAGVTNAVFRSTYERLTINSAGQVGIGDYSPDSGLKLDVEGKIGATQYCDENGANCTLAAALGSGYWTKSGTNDVYYNGGEVGIGISNPTEELVVNKSQAAPTTVAVQNTSTSTNTNTRAGITLQANAANVDMAVFGSNATGSWGDQTKADGMFIRSQSGTPVSKMVVGNGGNVPLHLVTNDVTRMTVLGNGNVGIGTTGPGSKLTVNSGTTNVAATFSNSDGTAKIRVSDTGGSAYISTNSGKAFFGANSSDTNNLVVLSSGNVGVGTNAPGDKLHIRPVIYASNQDGGIRLSDTSDNWNARIALKSNGSGVSRLAFDSTAGIEGFSMNSTGKIGLGTTTPSEELHVFKSQANPTTIVSGNTSTSTNTNTRAGFAAAANGGQLDVMHYGSAATGSLGGTTKADAAYIRTSSGSPSSKMVIGNGGAVPINFITTDLTRMSIEGGGDVGIGLTNPSVKLEVAGTVKASAFIQSSDKRLKQNIKTIKNPLEVLGLRGVTFDWKADGRPDYGFIAQEIETLYPELVVTNPETGLKAVNYSGMTPVLLEAIKTQQNQINALTKRLSQLESLTK